MARSREVRGIAAIATGDQLSPELVLVDPELAALERPHEHPVSVAVSRVVPLGVPLVPRDSAPARPAWLVVTIGLCLLASGLLVSLLLFRGPSTGANRPTTIVATATSPSTTFADPFLGPPAPNP